MFEKPLGIKSLDVKKREHLNEGVRPIIACIQTLSDFENNEKVRSFISGRPVLNAHNVDFYSEPGELHNKGFRNGGAETYVISPIDSLDKYSKNYANCTGLIISGVEKGTGKNISFMSHQSPSYFLEHGISRFSTDLTTQIQVIKDRCKIGTIDAVIVGGRYSEVGEPDEPEGESDSYKNMFIEEYLKSIDLLSKIVKKEIGFEPLVIAGPKTVPGRDNVYFDNKDKRLYLIRNSRNKNDFDSVENFLPSEMEEKRKNWKPGKWGLPI